MNRIWLQESADFGMVVSGAVVIHTCFSVVSASREKVRIAVIACIISVSCEISVEYLYFAVGIVFVAFDGSAAPQQGHRAV